MCFATMLRLSPCDKQRGASSQHFHLGLPSARLGARGMGLAFPTPSEVEVNSGY